MLFPQSISAEEIESLPLADFSGPITVVETTGEDFAEAIEYLSASSVIGFDTETKPSFKPHAPRNRMAILQLSGEDKAYIFKLQSLGLPPALAAILSDSNIIKVGAAVKDDLRGLYEYRKFTAKGFVDLQSLVEEYGIDVKSVRKMSAIILGLRVSKSQQLSNWEAPMLSGAQLKYAAIDAWACREMYLKLMEEECKVEHEALHVKRVYIKKGREESVKRFHPWIFSGAVSRVEEEPEEGEVVEVVSSETGNFMAYGHYQKGSITVRILSYDRVFRPFNGRMPLEFWVERFSEAYSMRRSLNLPEEDRTDCYRLVHGEGDSLPGLIVDIYNDTAVIQAHSAGMFLSLEKIAEALRIVYGESLSAIYDKSEGTAPFKAGLSLGDGYLWKRDEADLYERVVIENGRRFSVNWQEGQKTGFFLDQRDNRALVGEYSSGRSVLNLFCYTGGFSVYALSSGARRVVSVDSSAKAIEMVEKNISLNFSSSMENIDHTSICTDAMDYVKEIPKGEFDLIVVDPPAFAKHRGALENALRAYRRLNAAVIEKVAPGGLIFTYSCSQVVDRNAFALALFSAAAQTGRVVKILRRLTQPADHPVNIYHPEGEYLKGLLLYVE